MNTYSDLSSAAITRNDGRTYYFTLINGVWQPDADITDTLTPTADGWRYGHLDGSAETYDPTGHLTADIDPAGRIITYGYDGNGKLVTITGPFGHRLTLNYDGQGRLGTLIDPMGGIITYTYDDALASVWGNLYKVTYPDNTARIYHYENQKIPFHLTGISYIDASGVTTRYSTYEYYYNQNNASDPNNGKAILTQHAQTDNGAPQEKFTLAYNSATQTTVTDPVNMQEVMNFTINLGVKNLVSKTSSIDTKSLQQTFDANNNLTCHKDEEGHVTTYTYDLTTNQRLSMTEGQTGDCANPVTVTGVTRLTSYQYLSLPSGLPTDLPTLIESPSVAGGTYKKRITLTYGDSRFPALPTGITQSGYTPAGTAVSRTVGLGYNVYGQVNSINGPRTDVADITTLEYHDCTTGGACGQLKTVINALGHVTTYDSYDANGRLLQMTDPNGLVTTYTYDPRGRVKTVTQTAASGAEARWQYNYTPWGDVSRVIDPDGVVLNYQYDAAHYLRYIVDGAGNYLYYQYDLKGNRTVDATYDPSGVLKRSASYAYDLRNHLASISSGSVTALVADAVGNLTNETDGNHHATTHQYDALNRLFRTVNALNQNTDYAYDVNDRPTAVTAPNNLTTQYSYDDLGNLLQEVSNDRGTSTHTYDAAGNLRTVTNALGQVTTYAYDALNRVVSKQSSDANTPAYTYGYDSCRVGALCAVQQNGAAHLSFGYGDLGRLVSQQDTLSGTLRYTYTFGGRPTSITYPNNVVVNYTYDALGKVNRVSATANGVTTILADHFQHHPFGPIKSFDFGNGLSYGVQLDTAYRPWNYNLGYRSKFVYYDGADNIQGLNDSFLYSQSFAYDALNRLTSAADSQPGSYGSLGYTYIANGHRKTETRNGVTDTYVYYGSNQLSYNNSQWWIYFGTGAVRSGSALGYLTYDDYERVLGVLTGGYGYNAFDQRTRKTVGSSTTTFAYGPSGELWYEAGGGDTKAYVYVQGMLLARVDNNSVIYYYHTDHLGTPHSMTDGAGNPVWRAYYEPFGKAILINQTIVNNVRLAGQYYDSETGLHYWGARYYDPRIGRGLSADPTSVAEHVQRWQANMGSPIRLPLEANPYVYTANNPLKWIDPDGRALACHMCLEDMVLGGGGGGGGGSLGAGGAAARAATSARTALPDPYAGTRALSQTLRSAGMSRARRIEVINSFQEGTIKACRATGDETFIRFYGGSTPIAGRYLTTSFPSSGSVRDMLALPAKNPATNFTQFRLTPGSPYFQGTVAPNYGLQGGGMQIYVQDTGVLIRLAD